MNVLTMIKNAEELTQNEIDILNKFGMGITSTKFNQVGDLIIESIDDLMEVLGNINGEVKIDSQTDGFMNLKIDCNGEF